MYVGVFVLRYQSQLVCMFFLVACRLALFERCWYFKRRRLTFCSLFPPNVKIWTHTGREREAKQEGYIYCWQQLALAHSVGCVKKSFLFHRPRRHEAAVCYATLAFMIMTPLHLNNKKSVIYFFPSFQRVSLSQTREHNSTLFVKYRFCCLYFYMKQKLPITNPSKRSALSHTDAFIHSHIQCTYSCPPPELYNK